MRAIGGSLAVLAGAAMAITACSGPARPPASTTGPASSTPGPVIPSGLSPAPSGQPEARDDGSTGSPHPGSTLTLDAAATTAAGHQGEQVMRLFARRRIGAARWFAELSPLLTPDAAQAYQGTDPRNVPAQKVTGPGRVTPGSTAAVARVAVPTDVGIYLVILTRTDSAPDTWLAQRITPPETTGGA